MGTRGLFGFVIDGQVKATYNQYDSYPEGKGVEVLAFVTASLDSVDALKKRASDLRVVDGDSTPTDEDIEQLRRYADTRVSTGKVTEWYVLLRKTHGDLRAIIEAGVMIDDQEFAKDSLFCEWSYLVNLDDSVLEVYEGFQEKLHHDGRFASEVSDRGYYPIRLVESFPFSNLPTPEEFVKVLSRDS